jgi:hypothetical protein
MTMRAAIEVVAKLAQDGVIKDYAITGAVAALFYTQPALTEDLDILVSVADFEQRGSGLILLTPIESALAAMGYPNRTDVGILVEGWPVQFLPVASPLDAESLKLAAEVDVGSPPFKARVLRAEHIVAKAVSLGRLKDLARVEMFLEQGVVNLDALRQVLVRFALVDAWKSFCAKAGKTDPLGI